MVNLNDVANRAGVSKTLVSRVINNQSGVSPASRDRINEAIRELNYVPNQAARSLASKRTNTIGVIMDSLCEPYYFSLIRGIEDQVSHTSYQVLFSSAGKSIEAQNKVINGFFAGRADGIIIYGSRFDDEQTINALVERDFPFVLVESSLPNLDDVNSVIVDNYGGSKLAVQYLIDCGCKNVVYIMGERSKQLSFDRLQGYKDVIASNFSADDEWIIETDSFSIEDGYIATKRFLNISETIPDGIACVSDNTAVGAIMALQEQGILVPDDVMVVGFDNDTPNLNGVLIPGLTTVSQPLMEMGKEAVNMLLRNIEEPSAPKKREVFQTQLIVRQTTSCQ